MISHKALKRALHDGANLVVLHLEDKLELLLIIPGYAAHERHRKIATTIAREVIVAEIVKGGVDQLADALIVEVTMDEL